MNIEQSSNKFTLHDDKKPDLNDTRGKAVLPQAMQLLGEEDGRKISLKAQNTPQDAYFAFILLRHLRIRDIRIKVIDYLYNLFITSSVNIIIITYAVFKGSLFCIGSQLYLISMRTYY